jgi:hypothetical protein
MVLHNKVCYQIQFILQLLNIIISLSSDRCSLIRRTGLTLSGSKMQVVEVLNPLAREFKSIGTLRKELAELQQELAKAHNQVCYWNRPYICM